MIVRMHANQSLGVSRTRQITIVIYEGGTPKVGKKIVDFY